MLHSFGHAVQHHPTKFNSTMLNDIAFVWPGLKVTDVKRRGFVLEVEDLVSVENYSAWQSIFKFLYLTSLSLMHLIKEYQPTR